MSLAPFFLLALPAAAMAMGLREKYLLSQQISAIKYRINVNGTRGKSTITRLLVRALLEAGVPTIGKTTGTQSSILSFTPTETGLDPAERELTRPPEGSNIREVKHAIRLASQKNAHILVAECMALNPDYQKMFAVGYLKSNISIITNVLEDHLECMGPTLHHVAESFMESVPSHSTLIVSPGKFLDYFLSAASLKGIKVHIADPSTIPRQYCEQFSFPVFPENVALALKAALTLGVEEKIALRGMIKTTPDPGALHFQKFYGKGGEGTLINAFSANDPTSALYIWNYLREKAQVNQGTTVVMNCRPDRIERAQLFANSVLNHIATKSLILMGEGTRCIFSRQNKLPFQEVVDLGGMPAKKVAGFLQSRCSERDVFFGIGNYVGADDLCKELRGGGQYL